VLSVNWNCTENEAVVHRTSFVTAGRGWVSESGKNGLTINAVARDHGERGSTPTVAQHPLCKGRFA